jgi:hypothetical protein
VELGLQQLKRRSRPGRLVAPWTADMLPGARVHSKSVAPVHELLTAAALGRCS